MSTPVATITASYYPARDGDNPATQWLLYITSGVAPADPDPDVDTPTVVAMGETIKGVSTLSHNETGVSGGDIVKSLIRTRRIDPGPVNSDSASSAIVQVTISASGPAAPANASAEYWQRSTA